MYCHQCGTELVGKPKFCHKCGQPATTTDQHLSPLPTKPAAAIPGDERRARPRRLFACGVIVLVLVVVCGMAGTGIYFWLGLNQTNQAAEIVPADTVAFASFSPSLLQFPQLYQVNTLVDNAAVFAPLAALPGMAELSQSVAESLPLDLEIDPVNDVLPWIGREVSLAILNTPEQEQGQLTRSTTQAGDAYAGPPVILAAVTRNEGRSNTFLFKLRTQMEREGFVFENSVYQDVLITEIISPADLPLAYATFNDLVVLATDINTLHNAIDTALGDTASALNSAPNYLAVLDSLPANRMGYLYLDMPALVTAVPEEMRPWQLEEINQAGMALALAGNRVRVDFALQYDRKTLSPTQEEWLRSPVSSDHLVNQAPANSLLYFSGQNLPLTWETFDDQIAWDYIREIEDETGIDLVDDLLVSMSGENAWVILRDAGGLLGDGAMPIGLLLLADVEDRRGVEQNLEDLLEIVSREPGYDFFEDEINRAPVWLLQAQSEDIVQDYLAYVAPFPVDWLVENRSGDTTLGYGFAGNRLFVGTSTDVLRLAIRAGRSSLAENDLFQTAVKPLPNENLGTLFIDVQQSLRTWERSLDDAGQEAFNRDIRPYLENIRAISLAAEPMDTNDTVHGVLFILIE